MTRYKAGDRIRAEYPTIEGVITKVWDDDIPTYMILTDDGRRTEVWADEWARLTLVKGAE